MWRDAAAHLMIALGLSAALIVSLLGATAPSTHDPVPVGACYCRAAGAVDCLGMLTKPDCDKRCAETFCDDWFWLERRPCWNWGYGG
jgi:hypothetical protein